MSRAVVTGVIALAVVGAACTGSDTSPDDTVGGGATPPTTVAIAASEPPPPTVARIADVAAPPATTYEAGDAADLTSSIEIRVEEALTDYDAEREGDRTRLTVPEQVLFDFDKSQLRDDASRDLDRIVEVIVYYDDAPVEIRGHTDSRGSADYNRHLSRDRARAVQRYLVDAGVEPGRLTTRGLGATDPVAPNANDDGSDNPEGRQANRRVEILLPTDQR